MSPYRMKAGSWQPARLRWVDHAVLMIGLIVIAYLRGIDYLIGVDVWAARDFMIAAAPEWVWGGIGFFAGATILTFGVTTARHLLVCIGHGWLSAAYGLNALALFLAAGPGFGIFYAMGTVLIVTAMAMAAHRLVTKGKGIWAFALVLLVVAIFTEGVYLSGSFDGVRGAGAVGLVAYIHFIQMLRTGGRPLRLSEGHASEKVVDGGGEA